MIHFWQTIPGWCDFADYYADVVAALPDGARVVEVGVWQGQSTAALAVEIANSGKAIRLDVVDHFKGGPDLGDKNIDNQRELFDGFTAPIAHLIRSVHAEPSVTAARRYEDGSLDFVFIDAQHDAHSVLADLQAWYPKIKPGGILAGHDIDWPGVQQALKPWAECRGLRVNRAVSRRCWQVRRPVAVLAGQSLTAPVGQRRALVAVCSNERMVYRQTVQSLMALGWGQRVTDAAQKHGFDDVVFAWVSKHLTVPDLRNEAAAIALGRGCSHVIFLDADMTWPADVLDKLLAHHDDGIVSGLYHLKVWPYWPVALRNGTVNTQTWNVDYTYLQQPDGVVPVDLVGMGCAIIPTAVFGAMSDPWFEYETKSDGTVGITEDVPFCQRAKALGVPISLDASIACGHVGQQVITAPWHDRGVVEMSMLQADARKVVA